MLVQRNHCSAVLGLAFAVISCASQPPQPPPATAISPRAQQSGVESAASVKPARRVILFVWDGLRPDAIDPQVTPKLAELRDALGVDFRRHHSVYPTFTMMNAAAFATGARSGAHGFYGNTEYLPGLSGTDAKGAPVDYAQPFFTEDHAILHTIDEAYRTRGSALLRVQSLFEAAHAAGLTTAAVGKAGPVFLQDYRQDGASGVILDEDVALPRQFALSLQAAGFALPSNVQHHSYPEGPIVLASDNGAPTAPTPARHVTLADGVTPDPRATAGSQHKARNSYLMRVFLEYVLPQRDPALSVIWLRDPDSTEHSYGPGTPNVVDALHHQDTLLGELLETLKRLGRESTTDVLIASDHGHSSVGSDPGLFPLRALHGDADGHGTLGEISSAGYIVSGDVRSAEWLRHAGFAHVYDGQGCIFDPVLAGVDNKGHVLHEPHATSECGRHKQSSTPAYRVPADDELRNTPDAIVIAANGGSEYFYVPSRDQQLVQRLVSALQERRQYGAIFVRSVYGALPGTFSLARIGLEQPESVSPPTPDVVVSFDWDDAAISGAAPTAPGRILASPRDNRGTHGSFSPRDVHNILIAAGPDFRVRFADDYPSSNLDVAPTIAALFGFALPQAEGRVLGEALVSRASDTTHASDYQVEAFEERTQPVPLARTCELNDVDCTRPVKGLSYRASLYGLKLTSPDGTRNYLYLDKAKATRAPK